MLFGPVEIRIVSCCSEAAVGFAASADVSAPPAPSRVLDAFAGVLRVIGVAAVVVLGGEPLEDVSGALETGEVGSQDVDLDIELSNSDSCGRSPVTRHRPRPLSD